MNDLISAVPPHEPAEDALAFAGKVALGILPVVGPLAAESLAYALETRQVARQHDFNKLVAHALTRATERLDDQMRVEDVVNSDEFLAAFSRASRQAAETSSDSKRRRLAAAVASSVPGAVDLTERERAEFGRLANDLDDLHVWLLHFLNDPAAWLDTHGYPTLPDDLSHPALVPVDSPIHARSDLNPLTEVFGVPWVKLDEPIRLTVGDLEARGLVAMKPSDKARLSSALRARTLDRGRRFLAFIGEPDSGAIGSPPTV